MQLDVPTIIDSVYYYRPGLWDALVKTYSLEMLSKHTAACGKTALTYAMEYSPDYVVLGLIDNGIDPNIADISGDYPLHKLVEHRMRDRQNHMYLLLECLRKGADPKVTNLGGESVLKRAISCSQTDIVRTLSALEKSK